MYETSVNNVSQVQKIINQYTLFAKSEIHNWIISVMPCFLTFYSICIEILHLTNFKFSNSLIFCELVSSFMCNKNATVLKALNV